MEDNYRCVQQWIGGSGHGLFVPIIHIAYLTSDVLVCQN